jgi:hypothetical protein
MIHFTKSGIILMAVMITFISCTNVAFQQYYDGPKGINLKKGICIVNDIVAPIQKDEKAKLTAIVMKYLREMNNDSIINIALLRLPTVNGIVIPDGNASGFLDSLQKDSSYYYLFNVIVNARGNQTNDLYVKKVDFQDSDESEDYLDNKVSVEIIVIDIRANRQIYKQEIIASEMIDKDDLSDDDKSDFVFTRSSENVMKNALVKGLKDLKKHSK